MTHPAPRRLLLVAAPAANGREAANSPVRRYRLGRVLMGPEQLIGERTETSEGARPRTERDGRWRM